MMLIVFKLMKNHSEVDMYALSCIYLSVGALQANGEDAIDRWTSKEKMTKQIPEGSLSLWL